MDRLLATGDVRELKGVRICTIGAVDRRAGRRATASAWS